MASLEIASASDSGTAGEVLALLSAHSLPRRSRAAQLIRRLDWRFNAVLHSRRLRDFPPRLRPVAGGPPRKGGEPCAPCPPRFGDCSPLPPSSAPSRSSRPSVPEPARPILSTARTRTGRTSP